jgi:hypothetical protein
LLDIALPRLRDRLRDERDFLVFKGEVERAERRWRGVGRVDKALLPASQLSLEFFLVCAENVIRMNARPATLLRCDWIDAHDQS